jgi:hypothetical protein
MTLQVTPPPKNSELVSMFNLSPRFPSCLKTLYKSDGFFSLIRMSTEDNRSFELRDGLVYMMAGNNRLLNIPRGTQNTHSVFEMG